MADRNGLPFAFEMASRTVPRILWIGQSNACGQLEAYTSIARFGGPHTDPRVWAYKNVRLFASGPLTDGWGGLRLNQPGVYDWSGPDLVMAMDLVRNQGLAPEVIAVIEGNTSLAVDWLPPSGGLYTRLVAAWDAAIAAHPDAPASVVPWIVWIQGENDAADAGYAADYQANLGDFFAAIRTDLSGMADAQVVLVMLHEDCDRAYLADVRAAQTAYAASDARVHILDPSDLTLQGDAVHYTEATAITLGRRISAVIGAYS